MKKFFAMIIFIATLGFYALPMTAQAEPTPSSSLPTIAGVKVVQETAGVILIWSEVKDAESYAIMQDGKKIDTFKCETDICQYQYVLPSVPKDATVKYEIIALNDSFTRIALTSGSFTMVDGKLQTGTGSPVFMPSAPNVKDISFPSTKWNSLSEAVQAIINYLLGLAGILAVVAIVYSGIMYITAGSDQTKADNAKHNLTWAVTGVVIILLAYFIINEIANILGGSR